jgi:hypothetical protein
MSQFVLKHTDVLAGCLGAGLGNTGGFGFSLGDPHSQHLALLAFLLYNGWVLVYPTGPLYVWRAGQKGPVHFFACINNPAFVLLSSEVWKRLTTAEQDLHWVLYPPLPHVLTTVPCVASLKF